MFDFFEAGRGDLEFFQGFCGIATGVEIIKDETDEVGTATGGRCFGGEDVIAQGAPRANHQEDIVTNRAEN